MRARGRGSEAAFDLAESVTSATSGCKAGPVPQRVAFWRKRDAGRSSDERTRETGSRASAGVGHEPRGEAGRWAAPVGRGAEAYPVAGTHPDFVQDAAAVDVRAVARPEVTKPPVPIAVAHTRVSARHRRISKNTVAFARASERDSAAGRQGKPQSTRFPPSIFNQRSQARHATDRRPQDPHRSRAPGKVSNELFELRTTRCDEGLSNSGGERIE